MEKETKIIYILFGLSALSVILHNIVSAYLKAEEAVFFILALIFILIFFVLVIYNLIIFLLKRKPTDLWKLGFLGLTGILGFIPKFNNIFFIFFIFLGFFTIKNKLLKK